jgi:hypothetical protein
VYTYRDCMILKGNIARCVHICRALLTVEKATTHVSFSSATKPVAVGADKILTYWWVCRWLHTRFLTEKGLLPTQQGWAAGWERAMQIYRRIGWPPSTRSGFPAVLTSIRYACDLVWIGCFPDVMSLTSSAMAIMKN